MEERIKNIMAKVFGIPAGQITDESSPYLVPVWDSLNHMNLVLALQKEFGIRFADEDIPTMTSYRMIVNTISAYLE